jgi:hypothetical protein
MRRPGTRQQRGLPAAPRTAAAWVALPEISAGRYLFAEIGWVSSGRENAVVAGVAELPAPAADIDNGFVALPAVTVVGEDGRLRMFRLPVCYAGMVRRFVFLDDFLWGDRQPDGAAVTELPCHFNIGDRQDVYFSPEGKRTRPDG